MKVFQVSEPLFKTKPVFVFGCNAAQLQAYLLKHFKFHQDIDRDAIATMFTFQHSPYRMVWVQDGKIPEIAHEVFHLVTRICQDRGIRLISHDESGHIADEPGAYLMEFFMRAVLRHIRKK